LVVKVVVVVKVVRVGAVRYLPLILGEGGGWGKIARQLVKVVRVI